MKLHEFYILNDLNLNQSGKTSLHASIQPIMCLSKQTMCSTGDTQRRSGLSSATTQEEKLAKQKQELQNMYLN